MINIVNQMFCSESSAWYIIEKIKLDSYNSKYTILHNIGLYIVRNNK